MSLKKKNDAHFNPFDLLTKADIEYTHNDLELKIYFIDEYDFKEKALKNQIFHIQNERNKFSILLEREGYDLVPELFTKEVLTAQCEYFMSTTNKNLPILLISGLLITAITGFVFNIWLTTATAVLFALFVGATYMIVYLYRSFQSAVIEGRKKLRAKLIDLLGESKLDRLLDNQQKYAERRKTELN